MTGPPLLLGLDGGGAKTLCWLTAGLPDADRSARIIGRGCSGPSNPAAVGLAAACHAINQAIADAFECAGIPLQPADAGVLGLAGAGNETLRCAVRDWAIRQHIASAFDVVPDYELILAAGSDDGVGIALVSGAGSMVFGRSRSGQTARVGGWGYLMGDGGSAFAIGQAALKRVAAAFDTGEEPTQLTRRILEALSLPSVADVASAIYSAEDGRAKIASLAPAIFAAAETGDEAARAILQEAAEELARLVACVQRRLPPDAGRLPPVFAAGSVLVQNPAFREQVCEVLADRYRLTASFHPIAEPVRGALRLAERLL